MSSGRRAGPRPSTLFVFLDGVGLGDDDPEVNPLIAARLPALTELAGGPWIAGRAPITRSGRVFRALDATLGHPGLPQSATGQTALLTGRNAADAMRGHYGPWPGPTLRTLLAADGLFPHAAQADGAVLANAYPPGFFDALERRRIRLNAPAHAARAAGVRLRDLNAHARGEAVAPDLDGAAFARRGATPPGARPTGRALAERAAGATFTFLDLWPSDRAGHRRDREAAVAFLERLDAFVAGIVDGLGASTTLVITSDHGNLEDLRHGRHTRAAVPLLVVGPAAKQLAEVGDLVSLAPALRHDWPETRPRGPRR